MKQWLLLKSERERRLIIAAGVLFILAFVWFGIFTPLNHQIAKTHIHVNMQRNQLQWMMKQIQNQDRAVGKNIPLEKLAAIVNKTASRFSLALKQTAFNAKGITVEIEQAQYPALLRWLEALSKENNIQVIRITMSAIPNQGNHVSVQQLTLR